MTPRINYTKQELETLLKNQCGFREIKQFQLDHGLDLIHGKDVFLVIAPGSGKTTVMAAPLLAATKFKETGIALVIAPTKYLGEQLVWHL